MPIHAGHDDVGQQQVNGTRVGLRHLHRGSPVHGSADHVSLVPKRLGGKTKKIWFIFNEQNGLFAMLGFGRQPQPLPERWHSLTGVDARQINLEGRSVAGFAVHPDVASALLDDAVDRGKAETRSLRSLGGKERLEDVGLGFGVHADAGVADGEHHVVSGLHRGM